MEPKAAVPKLPLGWAKAGVLVRLKSSARNSRTVFSAKVVRLMRLRSQSRKAGPRTGLREALPIVNWGAVAKAEVLK